jgi:hypothetical protein
MDDHLNRFQELLREIFQFNFAADLDAGICRFFPAARELHRIGKQLSQVVQPVVGQRFG